MGTPWNDERVGQRSWIEEGSDRSGVWHGASRRDWFLSGKGMEKIVKYCSSMNEGTVTE